jgi:protein-tyrosine phosphatase
MTDQTSVLFVCLGNICRSPLAEAAFQAAAERIGAAFVADSAGTGAWHVGDPPDPRAVSIALSHGIDISHLRARQVTRHDFHRFTHIVALDRNNLAALERLRPANATSRLSLLLDHVPGREGEAVADPYSGPAEGFARTWAEVSAGAEGLLRALAGQA